MRCHRLNLAARLGTDLGLVLECARHGGQGKTGCLGYGLQGRTLTLALPAILIGGLDEGHAVLPVRLLLQPAL